MGKGRGQAWDTPGLPVPITTPLYPKAVLTPVIFLWIYVKEFLTGEFL